MLVVGDQRPRRAMRLAAAILDHLRLVED